MKTPFLRYLPAPHRLRAALINGMVALSSSVLVPSQSESAEPKGIVLQALAASSENLASGIGTGSFVQTLDGVIVNDATVAVWFDRGKFRLELDYRNRRVERNINEHQTAIWDHTSLVVATFAENIHPHGCHAYIYGKATSLQGATGFNSLGFPWDPSALGKSIADVKPLMESFDVRFERSQGNVITGRFRNSGGADVVMTFAANHGYNFTESTVATGERKHEQYRLVWKQNGPLWHISSAEYDTYQGASMARFLLKYDTFNPNAKVDPESFTLSSIGMPAGARMITQRPGQKAKIYVYDGAAGKER